uniref:Uncharacterized protein n=1 Tax=Methanococcus maripaludis (strain C6 / ATCC BAA-1332) TaxID=444158 RepID=A9A7F8_METM6
MGSTMGSDYTLEYVKESTFGTFPTAPTMKMLGITTGGSINIENIIKEKRYLPAASVTDKFSAVKSKKTGTKLNGTIQGDVIDLDFINEFVYIEDAVKSFSVGEINRLDSKYSSYRGCVVKDMTLECKEDDDLTCKLNFQAVDATLDSDTDYKGTGSHASDPGTDNLTYDDIDSILWGSNEIAFADFSIKLTNELKEVKDASSEFITKIAQLVPVDRKVNSTLTVESMNSTVRDAILNDTKADLKITIGDTLITLAGVGFKAIKKEFKPEDLVAMPLDTTLATGLTVAPVV